MKTYRNEELGFEIEIPEEWSIESISKVSHGSVEDHSIVFKCGVGEAFNIQIGKSDPELSLEQTENEFRRYAEGKSYFALDAGKITVQEKEHVWVRYLMGDGIWTKKYLISLGGIDYVITATCFEQKLLLQREKVWDAVAASIRVLELISKDLSRILKILTQPAPLSAMPQRIELCQQALNQVSRNRNPQLWGSLHLELAISFGKNPLGDRDENIEKSIEHHQQALEVFTRQAYPDDWANIQTNLASNYRNRQRGESAENIETAIQLCLQALDVFTDKALPDIIGSAHNNLANAYRERIRGERAENLEKAIFHCQQAPESQAAGSQFPRS